MVRVVIALAAVASLLGGCSSVERTLSTTVPSYASLPNGRDPMNPDEDSALGKRFSKGLFRTLQDQHARPLNILEISGGVTLPRMRELAATGADYISIGALTHSAPAVDLSFEIEPA